MFKRKLGKSGLEVSAMGLGGWAIGGTAWAGDQPVGWGKVDDDESIHALRRGFDLGVNLFDTADGYGNGHSEQVLGRAFAGMRERVIFATKFGGGFDPETAQNLDQDASPIRRACEASLRRLNTDYIDLYQFHRNNYNPVKAVAVREALEELVKEGKIRYYGWSTDYAENARVFATGPHCVAIQQHLNVFYGNDETLGVCEEFGLASINRGPLAMGLLTGKFTADSQLPADDIRSSNFSWLEYFDDGKPNQEFLDKVDAVREVLTSGGRTLVQGALAWLWGRSEQTIPIPGFKTVAQIEENVAAMEFGPLTAEQMQEIDRVLGN